jgi:hypothetical protein
VFIVFDAYLLCTLRSASRSNMHEHTRPPALWHSPIAEALTSGRCVGAESSLNSRHTILQKSHTQLAAARLDTRLELAKAAPGAPQPIGPVMSVASMRRLREKCPSTPESRARHARLMQKIRARRRVQQLLNTGHSTRRSVVLHARGSPCCRLGASVSLEMHVARLRQFQHWYRATASPFHRRYQESPELVRSLRLPLKSPSAWLAAVIAYWWMEDCARDAVGWLLAVPDPDWSRIGELLRWAGTVSRSGAVRHAIAGRRYRRGSGAMPVRGCARNFRAILSIQRWHELVVSGGGLSELVKALTAPATPTPRMTTSCAADLLSQVRGIGPYLAKNVINTLLSHGLLEFDVGIVGPGALTTVIFLRGGTVALSRCYGLWPNQEDDYKVRDAIAHLAALEGCHWLDMQHALCLWRSTDSFAAVSTHRTR